MTHEPEFRTNAPLPGLMTREDESHNGPDIDPRLIAMVKLLARLAAEEDFRKAQAQPPTLH